MEVNFNQLDILLRLIQERCEDVRVLMIINQQVQTNQKTFDAEFNQIQQSLRQMGFKVIAIKKHDKPRQDEENKILEYLAKITTLNLPERIYIYKFCQTVIKLFKPEMQIIRFNQKDSKDLLLMFKQYFMAENNVEILQQIQNLMVDQDFKMSSALILIKILVNKSREDFHNLIQNTSALVISKIKAKLSEQQQQQKPIVSNQEIQKKTEIQEPGSNESPKTRLWIQRKTHKQRESSNSLVYVKPTIILRSVSMVDKLLVAQSQQQTYQQQLQQQQQQLYLNPERELKLQLRAQQKRLKKKLQSNYKAIIDLDSDNYWAMHIILKKKFIKHSDKYFLQRGGFYLWSQLRLYNQSIRLTISNYQVKRMEPVQAEKLSNEQIQEIHRIYNSTCQSPRKSPQLPQVQLKSQSPQLIKQNKLVQHLSFLPQLQLRNQSQQQISAYSQVPQKPISFYDPNKDFNTSAQRSNKSLNLSQDQIRHKKSEHNSEIILFK